MKNDIINSCKVTRQDVPFCKPKIALDDIVCYKIIECINNEAYSIFGHGKYEVDIKENSVIHGRGIYKTNNWLKRFFFKKPKVEYDEESIEWNSKYQWYDITYGFIHSIPYCPEDMTNYLPIHAGHYELWKCVIPKKTRYYQANTRGSHWETNNSYASKRLKFIEKVNECDYPGWWHT